MNPPDYFLPQPPFELASAKKNEFETLLAATPPGGHLKSSPTWERSMIRSASSRWWGVLIAGNRLSVRHFPNPQSRDVDALAYSAEVDGQPLTLEFANGSFRGKETGGEWDILGRAVAGELAGKQLSELPAINHFWFSWAAFRLETRACQP